MPIMMCRQELYYLYPGKASQNLYSIGLRLYNYDFFGRIKFMPNFRKR